MSRKRILLAVAVILGVAVLAGGYIVLGAGDRLPGQGDEGSALPEADHQGLDTVVYHGDDFAGVLDQGGRVVVCDKEPDKNAVKVTYDTATGTERSAGGAVIDLAADTNCRVANLPEGVRVVGLRVCERNHISWDCSESQAVE